MVEMQDQINEENRQSTWKKIQINDSKEDQYLRNKVEAQIQEIFNKNLELKRIKE